MKYKSIIDFEKAHSVTQDKYIKLVAEYLNNYIKQKNESKN